MAVPFTTVVVAAAIAATAMTGVSAQQAPTFVSSTRLVTVAVSVFDSRTNGPVAGLTRDDFEVLSDDVPQAILQFSGDPGPVTVAVLLDASGSMAVNHAVTPAYTAASALLGQLSQSDRAGVFTFDRELVRRQDFAPIGPEHTRVLQRLDAFGSTSLYDAVLGTSRALATDGAPRRGVVVFTDGVDTSSDRAPLDVRTQVAGIDVPLYVVAIGAPLEGPLQSLADGTGGQLFAVGTPGTGPEAPHHTIISRLRQHYLLAFEPDTRPGWHRLSVRTRQKHTVRARAGYTVTPRS